MNASLQLSKIHACLRAFAVVLVICWSSAKAQQPAITFEITEGIQAGVPIAIVPFATSGLGNIEQPQQIIAANLARSGRFDVISESAFLERPSDINAVSYKNWRLIESEYLVVGTVADLGQGKVQVEYHLMDIFEERQLLARRFTVGSDKMRKVSHVISDEIYQAITGTPGSFDTRIAYILVQGTPPNQTYQLKIADADGYNAQTALESRQPLLSPAWSPDGQRIAYVSFENRRSRVYLQDLRTGDRLKIADFPGINSAPSWSPDGRRLALTLSKDGNPEIYVFDIGTSQLTRITRHSGIDTEPSWSSDGQFLIFTSSRSGNPQIYKVSSSGGTAQRLTFNGKYNAGAKYSNDGQAIVLVTDQGNGDRVGIYRGPQSGVEVITQTRQDESPSFSPNGDMVIYATQSGGQSVLAAVSSDGQVQQTIRTESGSVREPAWSPLGPKL